MGSVMCDQFPNKKIVIETLSLLFRSQYLFMHAPFNKKLVHACTDQILHILRSYDDILYAHVCISIMV